MTGQTVTGQSSADPRQEAGPALSKEVDADSAAPVPPPPFVPPPALPPSPQFSRIVDISWSEQSDGLKIVIATDGAVPKARYKHSRLGGENPRELIRFSGVRMRYKDPVIPVGGPLVWQIRTGYHKKSSGNELHVVIDLLDKKAKVTRLRNVGSAIEVIVSP